MKKGFTLVEVLTVIVILSILTLLLLPNSLKLFNKSKENAFLTEVRDIYKLAKNEYILDRANGEFEQDYCFSDNPLPLDGRKDIKYHILFSAQGNIVFYQVSDGSYQYSYEGSGLKITDIQSVQDISKINSSEVIVPNCGAAG